MRFMLRDDDACFFTDPQVLERAYDHIWDWCPVSLAVIPFVVETRNWGDAETFWQNDVPHPLGDNGALVAMIARARARGCAAIVQHGCRHRYLPGAAPSTWIPEFVHLDEPRRAIRAGREHLEQLFGAPVRTFTPPSNAVSPRAYRALRLERMHLTQLHPFRVAWGGSPADELHGVGRRVWARLRWGRDYPSVLAYGDRREVSNLPVTRGSDPGEVMDELAYRQREGGAVCVSTHHWELEAPLRGAPERTVGQLLIDVLEWLERKGAEPVTAETLLET